MPSAKRSSSAGPAAGAKKKPARRKPHKPPYKPPPDQFGAEPPIVITSGSVEIEMDTLIFPPDPSNPNKHKNASRKLTTIEIQDLSTPPKTLMTVDLKSLAGGKCKIIVSYNR